MSPTEIRQRLRQAGYSPLPLDGKIPAPKAWQDKTDATEHEIGRWPRVYPRAANTGVLTFNAPALDIDVMDGDAATAVEALARERFGKRGLLPVRFGMAPKRALLFRTDAPFKKIFIDLIPPGDKKNDYPPGKGPRIEMLGDGQQIVVNGVHPDTGRPYLWEDGSAPGDFARADLANITEDEAKALVADAVTLLVARFGYRLKAASAPRKGNRDDSADDKALSWFPEDLLDHDSLTPFAMKLLAAGLPDGAAVKLIRGAVRRLKDLDEEHEGKRARRLEEIPRMVWSARKKLDQEKAKAPEPEPQQPIPEPRSLDDVHGVFKKWLGDDYDIDVLDATLAAGMTDQLSGEPLWLLVISGSGNAKTETVQSLRGAGARVTSTIASEGALLSATPKRDKNKESTGGLLRLLGAHGVLVIKDVTSILSADRNIRGGVLAALREIYDGRWERNVGIDGGRTLTWEGRIVVVGAVTTAWDAAHSVIAAMGDRFVVIRSDSSVARVATAGRAIGNSGSEGAMRKEMADAVGGLLRTAKTAELCLGEAETGQLIDAANLVTWARTGVERDYKGEVVDGHAPEMPTRFAKQLAQLVRGGLAIGMSVETAMRLALRCAHDSIPPLRCALLLDIAAHPDSSPPDIHRRIGHPRSTVRKELEALHVLRLLDCVETEVPYGDTVRAVSRYRLTPGVDASAIRTMAACSGYVREEDKSTDSSPSSPPPPQRKNPSLNKPPKPTHSLFQNTHGGRGGLTVEERVAAAEECGLEFARGDRGRWTWLYRAGVASGNPIIKTIEEALSAVRDALDAHLEAKWLASRV